MVPPKSLLTIVLLLMLCVGSFPSSQMYSSFAHMGIKAPVMSTVYYTIAHFLLTFLCCLFIFLGLKCLFAHIGVAI